MHVEIRRGHAERLGDAIRDECVKLLPGHYFDDAAQHVDRHAVFPHSAGLVRERDFRQLGDHFGQALPPIGDVGVDICLVDEIVPVLAVHQPRGVPQQILHDHRPALWLEGQGSFAADDVGLLDSNLQILELGQVLRDRRQQIELAFLDEHHRRNRDDRLGHRRKPEDRVDFHRDLFFAVLITDRL